MDIQEAISELYEIGAKLTRYSTRGYVFLVKESKGDLIFVSTEIPVLLPKEIGDFRVQTKLVERK